YVRPYAYDFFDSVMCCGRILEENIRRMEEIRQLPKKRLFATGVPHYDVLVRERAPDRGFSQRSVVLVAPSWGPMSIFQVFGTSLVKTVARHYDVIVRPHPQMQRSQPELYREVLGLEGVTVDTGRTPLAAMAAADLLISDISGIVHEFAFVHEKPVIVIDHRGDVGGLEGALLGGDSELKELCREFITPVAPGEMENLPKLIAVAMERHSSQRIAAARADLVYNFGNAAPAAARQLQEILQCP
ncbi:MAG TPA: CDP-glycerol glycerophosphotransferase family protein, partial [Polyangiaceae bacterium]|nr:CDP-glycerol glycerophosphotransferase family protein [Polyangiaceae bacterium]